MRRRTGYVFYDEKYEVYRGRVTYTDPTTGKRHEAWVTGATQTEAWNKLDDRRAEIRTEGKPRRREPERKKTFGDLAGAFRTEKLIPAVFVAGRKVGGYKNTSTPAGFLDVLDAHFGKQYLGEIYPKDIEAYKLKRLREPTKCDRARESEQSTRTIAAVNRELEFLRTVLNWGEENGWMKHEQNPFTRRSARRLIERSQENKRERFPSFGEEIAILAQCAGERAHLRAALILGADTGLRRGELTQSNWKKGDADFTNRVLKLRAETTKTGRARVVPMTERVYEVLQECQLIAAGEYEPGFAGLRHFAFRSDFVLFGVKDFKRSFTTARRLATVDDLHFHDWSRHAFVTRAILAGIPVAVVLKATGHTSDEWKRYLNCEPDSLRGLWEPLPGQERAAVREYGMKVLEQLCRALGYRWDGEQSLAHL